MWGVLKKQNNSYSKLHSQDVSWGQQ